MNRWLQNLRRWWKRCLFWQTSDEETQTLVGAHHDHALVLSLQPTKHQTWWSRIRFLNHVLQQKEQRYLLIGGLVGIIGLISALGLFTAPHIVRVPDDGGTVTEGVVGGPKYINPLYATLNDVDRDLVTLLFSGLFRVNDQLEAEADIATTYRWIDTGKVLEVDLRPNVFFHDGTALSADDVMFTYDRARDPSWKSPLSNVYKTIRTEVVDSDTVRFTFEAPHPQALMDLTLGILPMHVWNEVPGPTAVLAEANLRPIGSGPYLLDSFKRDGKGNILSYKLARFDRYYGRSPRLDYWQIRFFSDRLEAKADLEAKKIDALAFVPWRDVGELRQGHLQVIRLELPQETMAFFNTKSLLFKDQRLREAFSMAVDEREVQDLLGDTAARVSAPFPFLNATTTLVPDIDSARTKLENLGWVLPEGGTVRILATGKDKKDGQLKATPSSTELIVTLQVPQQADLVRVAELLRRRWALLGAKTEIRVRDPSELLDEAVDKRDYQVILWNVLLPVTQDISPFWSSEATTGRGLNFANLADRDVDRALELAKNATSSAGLQQARIQVTNVIARQRAALFLVRPAYAYVLNRNIKGVTAMQLGSPADRFLRAWDWYVETRWVWR